MSFVDFNDKMNEKEAVQKVIDTIRKNGGEAHLVGGCVRDLIIGREPNDYDIATNLMPDQIINMFKRVIPTGIKHLTVTVLMNGYSIEVTTYRLENDYSDGRHPDEVFAADTIKEDLSRRDFTINAIASTDISLTKIIDYFDGVSDIKNKTIRCVGTPKERFNEDKLRALRAIRFSSQLNFKLSDDIIEELKTVSLEQISRERIQMEIIKILSSNKPVEAFEIMKDTGILKQIIPELLEGVGLEGGHHHGDNEDVWTHSMLALKESVQRTKNWRLRFTCILHDVGKPLEFTKEDGVVHFIGHEKTGAEIATVIMKRLKFSNDDISYVRRLIRFHMVSYIKNMHGKLSKKAVKKAVRNIGENNLWDMMILNYCDNKANLKGHTVSFDTFVKKKTIWHEWQEIKKHDSAMKVTDLAVNGHDMMKIGFKEKEVGKILNEMLDKVDGDELENNKESLLKYAKEKHMSKCEIEYEKEKNGLKLW